MRSTVLLALLLSACGSSGPGDAAVPDDAGALDAGAASDGGAGAMDAGPGPVDAGAVGDAGWDSAVAMDAGAPTTPYVTPRWWRSVQNVTTFGAFVELQPDGDVVLVANGGYRAPSITLGAGEPGETTFDVHFDPVIAWLDGSDGSLQLARQVAIDDDAAPGGSSVRARDTAMTEAGQLVLTGEWHGTSFFHPDTARSTRMAAERRETSGALHRAEDPYLTSWDADGAPQWLRRGRTPGPLTETWFNYAHTVAALPGGGFMVSGEFENTGFVVGDGTAGATTLTGTRQSYYAWLDEVGVPTRVERNLGEPSLFERLRVGPDGEVYGLIGVGSGLTLLADTEAPHRLEPAATDTDRAWWLVRFETDGAIGWTRRIVTTWPAGAVLEHAVAPDGRVVVTGRLSGTVTVEDGDGGAALTLTIPDYGHYAAVFAPDGTPEQLVDLGPLSATVLGGAAAGGFWVVASVPADAADAPVPLPDPSAFAEDASHTLLLRLAPSGAIAESYRVGVDVPVTDLAASADTIVLSGVMHCHEERRIPHVYDDTGALVATPDCVPDSNERAFVLTLDVGIR